MVGPLHPPFWTRHQTLKPEDEVQDQDVYDLAWEGPWSREIAK